MLLIKEFIVQYWKVLAVLGIVLFTIMFAASILQKPLKRIIDRSDSWQQSREKVAE